MIERCSPLRSGARSWRPWDPGTRGLRTALVLFLMAGVACEEERPRPSGTRPDAAVGDGSATDASASDAGPLDLGTVMDAGGALDAGHDGGEALDSGAPPDSSAPDASAPDSGTPDSGPVAVCGDGTQEGTEACDDGNQQDGDYCSGDCSQVTGRCGDGVVQSNETCDDGALTSGCDVTHDGGDGSCLPIGQCATGYLLDSNGDCVPTRIDATVIIDVDNFCNMTVTPAEITVPSGQTIEVDWLNRSRDYAVDVWMSYGGGYLDLATGATWDEPIPHCTGPNPHNEYADISTACSSFRFYFRCQ